MTKKAKSKSKNAQVMLEPAEIQLVPITDTLKDNFMPYAMSVIVSRAIPEIDGFKPSQRKLLYTMYRMGLMKGPRAKCADIVGQTMALNPHGDQTIYETMVRMTRGNGALINPWIDSKGNFGRIYSRDMQYAAYRYTEARLDPSCELLFESLGKDSVDFVDNYSGTLKEPTLLPAIIPAILVNSNQGIAVGMASNICSFNLKEVCDATIALLKDSKEDLLDLMPAPDFSTGARIIYDREQMRKIYESGRGSFTMQSVYRIDQKANLIEIVEIPFTTTAEAIIEDITAQVKKGRLKDINDVRDETDLNGLKITIEYKRSTDPELLIQKLLSLTSLTSNFACNFNLLIDGHPMVMGVREILGEWLSWRRGSLKRELSYDAAQIRSKLHLLKALKAILLDIDEAIRIVRNTDKESDVIPNLMSHFSIDQIQADYVAEIRLRNLNKEYLLNRIAEVKGLESNLEEIEQTLLEEKKLNRIIEKQLSNAAKKYGRERRTELVEVGSFEKVSGEQLIEDYRLKVFLTADAYLKKIPLVSLRNASEHKLKENDYFVREIEGSNKSDLLFFTNKAQVYKLKAYEIEDCKASEFGSFTPNILELDPDERVIDFHLTEDYSGHLLMVFEDGRAVRIEVKAYETRTRRKKLLNAFYEGAQLVAMFNLGAEDQTGDLLICSSAERMILCAADQVPLKKTRNSQGVALMSLKNGQKVNEVRLLNADEAEQMAYYRVRSLPASGRFIKDDLLASQQLSFGAVEE